jgi:hypothetical protein
MLNFLNYFTPNKDTNNEKFIYGLSSIINPYDYNRSILQGRYIRDIIGIKKFVEKIYINEMKLNFNFEIWDLNNIYKSADNLYINTQIKYYIEEKIKNINIGKTYFIYLKLSGHVNFIYINTKSENDLFYYFYDPHNPKKLNARYSIIKLIDDVFKDLTFNKKILPNYLLEQDNLPLCYMYVIHFFTCLLISDKCIIYDKISNELIIHNIYIMNFIQQMLKLCYKYKMIDTVDYLLLTNNTLKIYELINANKLIVINSLFNKTCDSNIIIYILKECPNVNLDISIVAELYDDYIDFNYIDIIFNESSKHNLPLKIKYELTSLSSIIQILTKKKNNNLDTSVFFNKKEIDINILKNVILNNYLFYACIKNYDIINYFLSLISDKNMIKYIINQQNINGDTLLHIAIKNTDKNMIKLLISNGADCYIKNKKDLNILSILLTNKNDELIAFIEQITNKKRGRE